MRCLFTKQAIFEGAIISHVFATALVCITCYLIAGLCFKRHEAYYFGMVTIYMIIAYELMAHFIVWLSRFFQIQ